MRGMWWMVTVVVVVVGLATYLTWSAGRVDRLHARVAAADAALDAHLVRRAVAAGTLAEAAQLTQLACVARNALDAPVTDREAAENDLTWQLRSVVVADDPVFAGVIAANRRVALTRQVHTDVVRDALGIRRRLVVRLLRMARNHPVPSYFDIDDPSLDQPSGSMAWQPDPMAPEVASEAASGAQPAPDGVTAHQ